MKKVLFLVMIITVFSNLVFAQSNTTTPQSYAFHKGSWCLGSNFGFGHSNSVTKNTAQPSTQSKNSEWLYNLNLNGGYMLSTYTQLGLSFDRGFYKGDFGGKVDSYGYGVSVTQWLTTDRLAPIVTLTSNYITSKPREAYFNTRTNGFNAVLGAGVTYYLVSDLYFQATYTLVSYQRTTTKSDLNEYKDNLFLVSSPQPINVGLFYNFTR